MNVSIRNITIKNDSVLLYEPQIHNFSIGSFNVQGKESVQDHFILKDSPYQKNKFQSPDLLNLTQNNLCSHPDISQMMLRDFGLPTEIPVILDHKPDVLYDNCSFLNRTNGNIFTSETPCNIWILEDENITRRFVNLSLEILRRTNCQYKESSLENCTQPFFSDEDVSLPSTQLDQNESDFLNASNFSDYSEDDDSEGLPLYIYILIIVGSVLILGIVILVICKFVIKSNDEKYGDIQTQNFRREIDF